MKKNTAPDVKNRTSNSADSGKIATRRTYMDKKDRREMLLSRASELVITHDWKTLTMSAVALHGQVSRQLVYQHFSSLENLLIDTAAYLFSDLWQQTASLIEDLDTDLRNTIRKAANLTLDLQPGHGDALWQILAGVGRDSSEMKAFYQQIRAVVIDLWLPRVSRELRLKKTIARGFIWAQVMALWGLRQMMRDGVINRKQATELFELHIQQTVVSKVKESTHPE